MKPKLYVVPSADWKPLPVPDAIKSESKEFTPIPVPENYVKENKPE